MSAPLVNGSAGDMLSQLAGDMGLTEHDPEVFADLATAVDGVRDLAELSVPDRRAAVGAVMFDMMFGDPDDETVPGGPDMIRRRAEWVLTPAGRRPLRDPKAVARALEAAADALDMADLLRGDHG